MKYQSPWLSVFDGFTFICMTAAFILIIFFTPVEVVMGLAQKIFYFHVASLWVGMLGFLVATIASIKYLTSIDHKWDNTAVSAIEISVVFFLTGIITGSLWAKPVWNTWWTWDPRLTSAAIVELIYVSYFLLRQSLDSAQKRARFGAVYAIMAFASVPFTFLSIFFLRTIHPVIIGSGNTLASRGMSMTTPMHFSLLFSVSAFTVFFINLLCHRIKLGEIQARMENYPLSIGE